MYSIAIKRILDLVVSVSVFVLAIPMFVVIVLLLLCNDGENPFFIHKRPGKNGRIFSLIKFRTMYSCRDENGKLLPDILRITPLGKFLRKTSLDEIPQFINVIYGNMSLVGPRPLLVSYLSKYNKEQSRRHEVRPGITGWAQVNGRNAISWEDKFRYDVWYVDNISFSLDIKILWMTFLKVIKSDGINAGKNTTMKPFWGSDQSTNSTIQPIK